MKTYDFTLHFTHGYADLDISAPNKAQAIEQACKQAVAFAHGDDNDVGMSDHYDDIGDFESIELDGETVFEASDLAEKRTIIITIEGGVIHAVDNIPDRITVEVHDFDVEGNRDHLSYNRDLDCLVTVWE